MTERRGFRVDDAGQTIVLAALFFTVLLFMVGLAIDSGQLYFAKRSEQEATDAAAFAGAIVIYQGGQNPPSAATVTAAIAAAVADATRNGYTDGVSGTTVTVNSPPTSGAFNGNVNHVEVIITRQVKTALVPAESAFNPVTARGVAGAEPLNNGFAVMALNRGNTPSAFTDQSNADIHLTGGGILVNSTNATALSNAQTSCSRFTITGGAIDVNGGTNGTFPLGCTPTFPAATTGYPQLPDPFAGFPMPSIIGLPVCPTLASCQDIFGNQNPGVYDVSLGGAGNTTINLNSGIYILRGHGINEAGNADIVSNTGGVFIFNTLTNYPNPGGTCAALTLAGNAVSSLAPLTTTIYAGMMLYQDPACGQTMTISGNGSFTGDGTVYLPNAQFVFNGNNATLTGGQLVADTVNIQNGNLNINYAAGTSAQPVLPRLGE